GSPACLGTPIDLSEVLIVPASPRAGAELGSGRPPRGRRRCRRGPAGSGRGTRAPLPTGGLGRCAVMDGWLLLVLFQGIGDRKPLRLRADPNVCHRSSPRVGVQGAKMDTDQREGSQASVYGRSTA